MSLSRPAPSLPAEDKLDGGSKLLPSLPPLIVIPLMVPPSLPPPPPGSSPTPET